MAWNAWGHMIVGQIAYNHLDPAVKAKCDALIAVPVDYAEAKNNTFVTAACWADDIKNYTSAYDTWHYIDLPISLDGTTTNGVVLPSFDVVQAIRQCIATLQSASASQTDQATALRFLLHFVGDIEQPLHCSTAVWASRPQGDSGGNYYYLSGYWTKLHSLWDDGGGYLTNYPSRPLDANGQATLNNKVAPIEGDYPYSKSVGSIPDPMDWALEGQALAQTVAYVGITNNSTPSAGYLSTVQATTEQRMVIGGQRLAKLLNTIFMTNAPSATTTSLSSGNFTFSWSSVSGTTYRVQSKQQLTDATWTDLTDITASTNSTSFSESTTGKQQRFYRAIVVN
ncbi:MAG TPA: S1/P1 nuclease [Verrucomicrobiae bacterium]|nr:S1/P1 nuclease [Verrucomicrobiae bacterium]